MKSLLLRMPNWVGDVLLATPALARLRARFPGVRIIALIRGPLAPLLAHNPHIDTVVPIDDSGVFRFLYEALRLRRHIAGRPGVVLPNSVRSALLLRCAGARYLRGFARGGRSWVLDEALDPGFGDILSIHEVEYYIRLVDGVAGPRATTPPLPPGAGGELDVPTPESNPLVYRVAPAEAEAARGLLGKLGLAATDSASGGARSMEILPWLAIAPGAAYGTAKRWDLSRYAQAATRIALHHGLRGVLVLGGPREREDAHQVEQETRAALAASAPEPDPGTGAETDAGAAVIVRSLAGESSIRETGALLASASLLLTNDSGLMHLASALQTPTVAIFGPTDPVTTAPWNPRARIVREAVECSPCLLRHCPIDHRCMARVSVDAVVSAAAGLLGGGGAGGATGARGPLSSSRWPA